MNIKYSKQKQEMREDPVLDFFFKAKAYYLKHANLLSGTAIVVVFIVGFVLVYSKIRDSSIGKAEEAFGKAMIDFNNRDINKAIEGFTLVADNHRTTPQGAMSCQMLGSIFLSQGREDAAIKWFEIAAAQKNELGFIGGEALEGIASCYEAKGDIPKALDFLEKALRDNDIKYRHPSIRWKMALLNQKINNSGRAEGFCRDILSDTSATDYRQRAENLLASLSAARG